MELRKYFALFKSFYRREEEFLWHFNQIPISRKLLSNTNQLGHAPLDSQVGHLFI